ncbi:hypothetical protein [Streptomyces sp. NPDC012825]|uniref:hypothetical protein n=1 Tax=Streptomyces sp. NPDC012825 TaxID=3364851 RepID=UPI0036BEDA52
MKLVIDHADLAAAVGYAARTLPSRPSAPVLAGLLLDATGDRLRGRAFDYDVSPDTTVPATVTKPGRALVPGRLLADITATRRGDVHPDLDGTRPLPRRPRSSLRQTAAPGSTCTPPHRVTPGP